MEKDESDFLGFQGFGDLLHATTLHVPLVRLWINLLSVSLSDDYVGGNSSVVVDLGLPVNHHQDEYD